MAPIVTQPVTENRNYLFYQLQQLRAIHKQEKHGEFPPDGAPAGLRMRRTLRCIDWPIRMIDPRSVGNVYIQTSTAGDVLGGVSSLQGRRVGGGGREEGVSGRCSAGVSSVAYISELLHRRTPSTGCLLLFQVTVKLVSPVMG